MTDLIHAVHFHRQYLDKGQPKPSPCGGTLNEISVALRHGLPFWSEGYTGIEKA